VTQPRLAAALAAPPLAERDLVPLISVAYDLEQILRSPYSGRLAEKTMKTGAGFATIEHRANRNPAIYG